MIFVIKLNAQLLKWCWQNLRVLLPKIFRQVRKNCNAGPVAKNSNSPVRSFFCRNFWPGSVFRNVPVEPLCLFSLSEQSVDCMSKTMLVVCSRALSYAVLSRRVSFFTDFFLQLLPKIFAGDTFSVVFGKMHPRERFNLCHFGFWNRVTPHFLKQR